MAQNSLAAPQRLTSETAQTSTAQPHLYRTRALKAMETPGHQGCREKVDIGTVPQAVHSGKGNGGRACVWYLTPDYQEKKLIKKRLSMY